MAIRRATQKAQVIEVLRQAAPPGEVFVATVHSETGPSPWLNAIFDEVPFLGLIIAFTRRFYFLTVTNTSVVVNSASRWTNRPGPVVAAFPRAGFPVVRVNRAAIWSSIHVMLPGSEKPTRLNIHRYWRGELDQLLGALPHAAALAGQPMPGQPYPQQATPGQAYPAAVIPGQPHPGQPAQPYPGQAYPGNLAR